MLHTQNGKHVPHLEQPAPNLSPNHLMMHTQIPYFKGCTPRYPTSASLFLSLALSPSLPLLPSSASLSPPVALRTPISVQVPANFRPQMHRSWCPRHSTLHRSGSHRVHTAAATLCNVATALLECVLKLECVLWQITVKNRSLAPHTYQHTCPS